MNQQCASTLSRRRFLGTGAAAAATLLAQPTLCQAAGAPNSNFGGVQIGTITYSYRGMPGSAEDLLKYITQCGISSVELMGDAAEQFAGVPSGAPRGRRGQEMTEEQRNEAQQQREQQLNWRLSVSMDKYKALRKLYNDAGVNIHIVKFGNIGDANMSDGEIDYYFNIAKALGAKGITRELSEDAAKRLGSIADTHEIMIGFHNHTQITPTTYDGPILSYGKYLGINPLSCGRERVAHSID